MKKGLWIAPLTLWMAVASASADTESARMPDEAYRPELFARFTAQHNTPDGLASDRDGNLFLSVPNFANKEYPGMILKMDKRSGVWSCFTTALIHPDTGRGSPMGLEFDLEGNLYYCDCQYFNNTNGKSRVMRVRVDKNGEPVSIEPVAENLNLANAVRVRGNAIFFTDTFFDLEGRNLGGVYRVPISAFRKRVVKLLPKEQWESDPYCLGVTETTLLPQRGERAAADGLCFDKNGNLYTGNFGDGHLYILKLRRDGNYDPPRTLYHDPQLLSCVDGLTYYARKDWIVIADSERNAIHYWDIKASKLGLLWMNDDTNGADGLLDQPCETIVWNNKLIVANFDLPFPGVKNTKADDAHTLSIIELEPPRRWFSRWWR